MKESSRYKYKGKKCYICGKEVTDNCKTGKCKSCGLIGHKRNVGRVLSEEHKNKLRLANRISNNSGKWLKGHKPYKNCKDKNGRWNGGTSHLPYSLDWKETLKRSIRERDKYICQLCSKQQGNIAHHIHHIDYNKLNCNPNNLITLCHSCHSKTNKDREKWVNHFKKYGKIKS